MPELEEAIEALSKISGGQFLIDVHESLLEAVMRAGERQKKASVTATLTVTPGRDFSAQIKDSVVSKLPGESGSGVTVFLRDGKLRTDNPDQGRLEVRDTGDGRPTFRAVPPGGASYRESN